MKAKRRAARSCSRAAVGLLLTLLTACGSAAAPPQRAAAALPAAGLWTLTYSGDCQSREAETVRITRLDAEQIVFDDTRLQADAAGSYSGGNSYIAPMPADGRDIVYTIDYRLQVKASDALVGTETVVESGGHGLSCPIALDYRGEG